MPGQARQILAQKLRKLRFIKGWSQEDLAEASGLHRTYISAIECGKCNVSLDNIEKLATAFGVTLDFLLRKRKSDTLISCTLSSLRETTKD